MGVAMQPRGFADLHNRVSASALRGSLPLGLATSRSHGNVASGCQLRGSSIVYTTVRTLVVRTYGRKP